MSIVFIEEYWNRDDKSGWGSGRWNAEPDKVVWVDEATGLDCMINRNKRLGFLCGYVGVPKSNTHHGKGYDDAPGDVNGGLTFASACFPAPEGPEFGVCHIEQPGRPENVWWFGFDCGHLYDTSPGMTDDFWEPNATYKTFDWVVRQVTSLATQLAVVN